jgi:hypothetical protein
MQQDSCEQHEGEAEEARASEAAEAVSDGSHRRIKDWRTGEI